MHHVESLSSAVLPTFAFTALAVDAASARPESSASADEAGRLSYAGLDHASQNAQGESLAVSRGIEKDSVSQLWDIADFYFHVGSTDDAFPLYGEIMSKVSHTRIATLDLVVVLAYLISTDVQDRSAGSLLRKQFLVTEVSSLLRRHATAVDVEIFLTDMLRPTACGQYVGRCWKDILVAVDYVPLQDLQALHVSLQRALKCLPSKRPTIDFLVYDYGVRLLEAIQLKRWDGAFMSGENDPFKLGDTPWSTSQLQAFFLSMTPGPFMLSDGVLGNGCLTSTFRWCMAKIEDITHGRVAWRDLRVFEFFRPSRRRQSFFLFCVLWECFHGEVGAVNALQIKEQTGLIPDHFLKTISTMIVKRCLRVYNLDPYGRFYCHPDLSSPLYWFQRFLEACKALCNNEALLAREFLGAMDWEGKWCEDIGLLKLAAEPLRKEIRSLLESYVTVPNLYNLSNYQGVGDT